MAEYVPSLIYYLMNISPKNGKTPIDNTFEIYMFMYHIFNGISYPTRLQVKKSSSGCKFWQLIIAMLLVIQTRYASSLIPILTSIAPQKLHISNRNISTLSKNYGNIINICKGIYYNIQNNRNLNAFNKLFNNVIPITDPLLQDFTDSNLFKIGANYFCIYKNTHVERFIHHYFTIFIIDNQWWLTSAYGSDFVTVPAYTTLLDLQRFYDFVTAFYDINNPNKWKIIEDFYKTYFFQGNIPVYINDELTDFYGKELFKDVKGPRLNNGTTIEIPYVFQNKNDHTFRVGIIPTYENIIQSIYELVVPPPNPSSGGTIKRKSKKTRKRNKK
jgi:hypothetical protein